MPDGGSKIRLLVRADDIGSSHSANLACLKSFRDGIARSVEIMATGPWFEEAVELLQASPDFDVGVHLTLTSEWTGVKWRPITHAPSLVDADGYFYPALQTNRRNPPERSLLSQPWHLHEVEAEFRAQIELVRRKLPWVSHLTGHMGCSQISDEVVSLTDRLAKEYGLFVESPQSRIPRFEGWCRDREFAAREQAFIDGVRNLQPGIWLFVEHPGLDTPEMRATRHPGYDDVALDRGGVTAVWTSPKVKRALEGKAVELINYKDLPRL